jgi:hypothetical protein
MWEKLKFYTRVTLFSIVALYVLIFVIKNYDVHLDKKLNLIFAEYDRPNALLVLIFTAIFSIIAWWLFRTIFKTVRQFRTMQERARTARLEKEVAEMKAKAQMLQSKATTIPPSSSSPTPAATHTPAAAPEESDAD